MKKKIIIALAVFAAASPSAASPAAYLIELKSGAAFVTPRYWEENDQIKCQLYGGVTGFQKNVIQSIHETNRPYNYVETVKEAEPLSEKSPLNDETGTVTEKHPPAASSGPPISDFEKELYLQRHHAIETQFKSLARQYRNANSRLKRSKSLKKINALKHRYTELRHQVNQRNGGVSPPWWPEIPTPKFSRRS